VTDGEWIIALGVTGFLGFGTLFGLLLWPLFAAARKMRKVHNKVDRRLISGISLTLAMCAVDLLPNSLGSNYPYFLAGALLSVAAAMAQEVRQEYLAPSTAPVAA
jgi:hypothetical protein